jgi:hypothetical protein
VRTYSQIGPQKPIKDATEELLMKLIGSPELVVPVGDTMVKLGKRDDPLRCVLTIGCRAVLRDKKLRSVQVLRTRSYLEFPEEVLRLHNDVLTTAMITVYDLSGKFTAGEYRLLPMPESARFDAQKEKRAKPKEDDKKKKRKQRSKRMRPRGEHRVAWMQMAPVGEEEKP